MRAAQGVKIIGKDLEKALAGLPMYVAHDDDEVEYYKVCSEYLSHVMRKPTFCICENKAADQLRGNREADQRLCFRYIDSTIPLLSRSEISSI